MDRVDPSSSTLSDSLLDPLSTESIFSDPSTSLSSAGIILSSAMIVGSVSELDGDDEEDSDDEEDDDDEDEEDDEEESAGSETGDKPISLIKASNSTI